MLDQGWRQKSLAKIQAVTDGFPGPSKKSAKTRARAPASDSDDSSVASVAPPASVASERKAGLRRKNNKSSSGKSLSRLTRDKNFEQREAGYRSREKVQAAALTALQLQVAALSAATPAAQPHGAPYAPPASAPSRATPTCYTCGATQPSHTALHQHKGSPECLARVNANGGGGSAAPDGHGGRYPRPTGRGQPGRGHGQHSPYGPTPAVAAAAVPAPAQLSSIMEQLAAYQAAHGGESRARAPPMGRGTSQAAADAELSQALAVTDTRAAPTDALSGAQRAGGAAGLLHALLTPSLLSGAPMRVAPVVAVDVEVDIEVETDANRDTPRSEPLPLGSAPNANSASVCAAAATQDLDIDRPVMGAAQRITHASICCGIGGWDEGLAQASVAGLAVNTQLAIDMCPRVYEAYHELHPRTPQVLNACLSSVEVTKALVELCGTSCVQETLRRLWGVNSWRVSCDTLTCAKYSG
ncbi:hypothetical protein JKP88DRAFT_250746 [Tribonema minus]|uniref:Uncharacterized protein n=1 Tax=Tribonema minus TaxID=303371 RepID=A0A835ZI41_9STRA|nr:hypothetical protein JKP88DRAFT_250746 [Tribonema minus]